MSSSALVAACASSEVRWGNVVWNVPTPELVSSTCPVPSMRVPFQAVRAVRIAMSLLG